MALVFLGDSGFAGRGRLEDVLRNAFPAAASEIEGGKGQDPLFIFVYEGVLCTVMCMDAPAPMQAADPQFVNAWFWPTAWDELSKHRAHIVVSTAGGNSPKHRALILQRLLSATLSVSPSAIGVNYASSGALLPTKLAFPMLQQADQIALMLFLSCFFAREAEGSFPRPGIFASTKGLSDFGVMEIEAHGFTGQLRELQPLILSFASSLLEQQSHFKDGDTLNVGDGENI